MGNEERYRAWLEGVRHCVYEKKMRTQVAIASESNIEKQSLNAILKERQGKRASSKLQDKIAQALGMSYESMLSMGRWILEGKDPEEWVPDGVKGHLSFSGSVSADVGHRGKEFISVPKYRAKLSGGQGSLVVSDQVEANLMFRNDFLSRRGQVDKMALFEVIGNSMEPFIYDGDVVLVDMSQTDIVDGKAYAYREDHTVKIKRLSKQGGVIIASSENAMHYPAYPVEVDNFHLIGRVIWVGHEVR